MLFAVLTPEWFDEILQMAIRKEGCANNRKNRQRWSLRIKRGHVAFIEILEQFIVDISPIEAQWLKSAKKDKRRGAIKDEADKRVEH